MTQIDQQNVPELRFPEFEEQWKKTTLGSESECLDNLRIPLKEGDRSQRRGKFPYYGASGVIDYIDDYLFNEDLVLLAEDGANIIMRSTPVAFIASGQYWVNNHAHVYRAIGSTKFLAEALERINYTIYNTGTAQPKLNGQVCKKLPLIFPTLPEQSKIAGFLGAVDERIAQMARKKALLEEYKRGCIQQLFSQSTRFKDDQGNNFPDWKEKPLNAFLTETKKKSDRTEPVFSVSVNKGLIDQIEHLGRSFSADDTGHYNRVEPGDIVYTKSPTGNFPLGIIKQSRLDKPVIVSPLYGVFRPETEDLGYLLHVYFESHINTENYLKPIIQKGAKNTINITNKTFLSAKLKVPVHQDEQRRIADFLKAIDTKIDLTAQELGHAQSFKKGLLQQMFV